MAYTNLSFDYIAIFFSLMLLIWYKVGKKVPLKSFRCFLYVLVCLFMASVLETVGYLIVRYNDYIPLRVAYYTTSFQLFFIHNFIIIITYTLFCMAHINVKKNKLIKWIFNVSWVVVLCTTIPCIWIDGLFTLESGEYIATGLGNILYPVDGVMVTMCIWVLTKRKENFKFLKTSITTFILIASAVCGVAQVFKFAPMLNFAITILSTVLYLYQVRSDVVTDEVTGQLNRMFFGEYLRDKFIDGDEFSVLVVDLDDFKYVNQGMGVNVGDKLLREIGVFLESMHSDNVVIHFEADQFCVIVGEAAKAVNVAEDIKERFSHGWVIDGKEILITATICIVECPVDADRYSTLVEVIDYSMESAKDTNKSGISLAYEQDLDRIHKTKQIEKAVKRAVAKRNIQVHYQPIFSTKKGLYNSAEALARIYDEELGWIAPDIFIPMAEKNGIINELGDIVLDNVCRFIKEYQIAKTTIEYIEINVSPVQLMQKDFSKHMLGVMEKYDVLPSQINVEVTETEMINAFSVVNSNLRELVDNGIEISLDDYGSGYANINYMNHMPFKFVKIDKDIIWQAFKNDRASTVLEYTISMLAALELNIVAEGVETEEMSQLLAKFGCQYLQGWYYSRAIPEKEFISFIKENSIITTV